MSASSSILVKRDLANDPDIHLVFYKQTTGGGSGTSVVIHKKNVNKITGVTKKNLQDIIKSNEQLCLGKVGKEFIKYASEKNLIIMVLFDKFGIKDPVITENSISTSTKRKTRSSKNTASSSTTATSSSAKSKRTVAKPTGTTNSTTTTNSSRTIDDIQNYGKPVAFLLAKYKYLNDANLLGRPVESTNEIYIDLVCSAISGGGEYLIKEIINFADQLKYDSVSLKAIPTVLSYYPRLGFLHRHTCNSNDPITPHLKREITDTDLETKRKLKEQLRLLRENKFGIITGDPCGKDPADITDEEMITCAEDGYMMRRCKTR